MECKNLLKDSKAYYEKNDYYEIFSKAEDYNKKVYNHLKKIIEDKIVLDAGCGTGKYLPLIENAAKKYIGVDLSSEQLKKAKKKKKKQITELIEANLADLPIKDNSVDLIISTWVLGTIVDLKERKKCLSELLRVLKNNGQIVLVENNTNGKFEEIRNRVNDTRTKDYNKWLLENGFVVEKEIEDYFKFNSKEEAIKCFDVIYGSNVSCKIDSKTIEHRIIIFEYEKIAVS